MQTDPLQAAWQQSNSREYDLDRQSFAEIYSHLPSSLPIPAAYFDDWVLAQACARGHEGAWRHFMTSYQSKLMAAAMTLTRDSASAQDLLADLYGDLYGLRASAAAVSEMSGDAAGSAVSRKSKLLYYSGRGSLAGWLRATLAQMQVDRHRRRKNLVPLEELPPARGPVDFPATPLPCRPENTLAQQLALAFAQTLEEIAPRDRTLLALYFLDEMTLTEIGRLFHFHESTASRRLAGLLRKLRQRLHDHLREQGCSPRQIEELLQGDVASISFDLQPLLARLRSTSASGDAPPQAQRESAFLSTDRKPSSAPAVGGDPSVSSRPRPLAPVWHA